MQTTTDIKTRKMIQRRYVGCPIKAKPLLERIENLSDFFAVFDSALQPDKLYWFRGHSKTGYKLVPSALRYKKAVQRKTALAAR